MRLIATCCLLLAFAALQALETPLILKPSTGIGDQLVVVNPSMGTVQLYQSNIQQLSQLDSGNFLADLERISKLPTPGRIEWPLLRVGTQNMVPTYGQMFEQILPAMSRRPERGDDRLTLQQRALNTEEEFFAELPEFDGLVRGAMLNNSFILVIPSTYTILFYTVENNAIELQGWRNYRADLYIPQVYQSRPTPQDLLRLMGQEVLAERREALEKQMEELGEDAGKVIPLQASDPWVGASDANGQLYVLVDPANTMALAYQYISRGRTAGLQLQSARNLEIDLMIPTVFNSVPNNADLIKRYNNRLKRAGQPPVFREQIEQLAQAGAVRNDQMSSFQAVIDDSGILQLDFQGEKQLLTYRISAAGLDLVAGRDYTIETGIGIHQQTLTRMQHAAGLEDDVEDAVGGKQFDGAFKLLEIAFDWNPWLVADWARNRKIARLEKQDPERWIKLITSAQEEAKRRDEQQQKILEAAEAAAKAREERGR